MRPPLWNTGSCPRNPFERYAPVWLILAMLSIPFLAHTTTVPLGGKIVKFELTSTAFRAGEMIPSKYTCDGPDVSPPLAWTGVPQGTQSLALIVDDPDAPRGTWVHWVLYDIPAQESSLPEAVPPDPQLKNGARNGKNDFQRLGYGGPCPPSGTHRYFFKLYALDKKLGLPSGATKAEVLKAMEGHILGQAELMGTYKRR
ncbi:hypothetical protein BRCON_0246 [Candidatus Sumerlaea chitinivorans]|uniref:Phospholipid-binding protein n=1 Tax=Sumerlaea chitinivorans TaxID=2250252 RepID=A0A2Z4Y322_SUMC1|nr:hypothetical protein BRCON_0246 [Candidatus Sumerlaea chitinivorans]